MGLLVDVLNVQILCRGEYKQYLRHVLSNNIENPIKHDEGTAYIHHGTGFEHLKHQPINPSQIFNKDEYKDRTNP
jgi:hypothetical protein